MVCLPQWHAVQHQGSGESSIPSPRWDFYDGNRAVCTIKIPSWYLGSISRISQLGKILDYKEMMIVIMLLMVFDRTTTATFRAAAPRRTRRDGGSTGEIFQMKPSGNDHHSVRPSSFCLTVAQTFTI